MLYNNVLVSARHQHESVVGMHMSPPSCNSLPAPTPTGCHRAPDLSSLHRTAHFHWLSNFAYGNVYVSTLPSQFIPPSLSPTVFKMSVSFAVLQVDLQYYLSIFHLYVLIHHICLSFSDLLYTV